MSHKITLKLVRSFSVGFDIFSPKFNGFYVSFNVGCFSLCIWNRGCGLLAFENYWNC